MQVAALALATVRLALPLPAGAGLLHCLVAGPVLVLAGQLALLHVLQQAAAGPELYYLLFEVPMTALSLVLSLVSGRRTALYSLFYCDLLIALTVDLYCTVRARGWTV